MLGLLKAQGVIDKDIPTVDVSKEEIIKTGAAAPYAVKITLKPNEAVYCSNYGQAGVEYSPDSPMTVTVTENGVIDYIFADKAGNRTGVTVDITNIDRTAPKLSFTPDL